jgi:hypothetical protein
MIFQMSCAPPLLLLLLLMLISGCPRQLEADASHDLGLLQHNYYSC